MPGIVEDVSCTTAAARSDSHGDDFMVTNIGCCSAADPGRASCNVTAGAELQQHGECGLGTGQDRLQREWQPAQQNAAGQHRQVSDESPG